VVAVHDLLTRVERPDATEVREELAGNICRCTGYGRVLDAVARAVDVRMGER
jgi:carbon-monoxide dehydrogenase small subunit